MKTKVTEYRDKKKGIRNRVTAAENGRIIHASTQGYTNREDLVNANIRAAKSLLFAYDQKSLTEEVKVEMEKQFKL